MENSNLKAGCLLAIIGSTALVAVSPGPIDTVRSIYHTAIGDGPILKRDLLQYAREGMKKQHPDFADVHIEDDLWRELGEPELLIDGTINPQEVSIYRLWDAVERHPKSYYGWLLGPRLGK